MNFLTKHFEDLFWSVALIFPILAAIVIERRMLPAIALAWILAIFIVVPLHFWRAWRRLRTVPNKTQYATWVGFETLCVLALIAVSVYGVMSR